MGNQDGWKNKTYSVCNILAATDSLDARMHEFFSSEALESNSSKENEES